jgi:putative Holliday junction resolvase
MRILGIDYGRRRLGLAVSDEGGILASPLPVYARRGEKEDITFLSNLASERRAGRIVIGLPLNMDGSSGEMADEVVAFAAALHDESGLLVDTFDERLTSVEAERVLVQARRRRTRQRRHRRHRSYRSG